MAMSQHELVVLVHINYSPIGLKGLLCPSFSSIQGDTYVTKLFIHSYAYATQVRPGPSSESSDRSPQDAAKHLGGVISQVALTARHRYINTAVTSHCGRCNATETDSFVSGAEFNSS